MSMGALIEKFRAIGLDRLERMNSLLVSLEREREDKESIEELFREIHTLKGEAKMMGFVDINLVAHQTENVLIAICSPDRLEDIGPIDLAFEGLDLMLGLLTKSAGAKNSPNLDLTGFVDRVSAFTHGLSEVSFAMEESEATSVKTEEAREVTTQRDALSELSLEEDSLREESLPEESLGGEASSPGVAERAREEPRTTKTRIKSEDTFQRDGGLLDAGSLKIQASSSLRVDVEKLERLGDIAGETLLMSRRLGYQLKDLGQMRVELRELFRKLEEHLPKSRAMDFRNLIHRLDACETGLREENHLVNLRASQLDAQARRLRHIPLAQVLSHYPRAIRDLASGQGKKVRLVHSFGNVEVDRVILSALSEPLLHLARNAVDHGIEGPDERKEMGKELEGEITLTADYFGDSIRVMIRDDGRGIDPDRIRRKAREKGLLNNEAATRLSDQEAMAMIFEPGFSTQDQVTDVSGRGMGMNVVRQQITRIGGFIEIESEVGAGTTFTVHLPVSSAISSILMITLGDRPFALTAKDVEQVQFVEKKNLTEAHGGVCVKEGKRLIPLVDWSQPLGLAARGSLPDTLTVVMIRKGTRRVALWVDDVIGEREAIARPLGEFLSGLALCRGVALTDSGAVVPLLNVVELIERTSIDARVHLGDEGRGKSFTAVGGQKAIKIKTILVVEDSEVTRSLVVSILKNQAYRVLEAEDGQQGWEMLQRNRVHLVLTDIQMPRKDGLTLLKEIRASDKYGSLPVVILTTLGGTEDKRRAMRLGADGYLVKLSFEEEELIETVERFLE